MTRPDDRPSGRSAPRNSFPRSRRLKRERLIRALFDRKRTDVQIARAGALVVRYRIAPSTEAGAHAPLQVGFATGRHIRTKPLRNRVKRIMRETFRVHQHALVDLFSDRPGTLTLMVLYRGDPAEASSLIPNTLPLLLAQVERSLTRGETRSA